MLLPSSGYPSLVAHPQYCATPVRAACHTSAARMRGPALLDRQPICQGRIAAGCPFLRISQAPSLAARCSAQLQQTRRPAWRREAACQGRRCRTHNQHAASAAAGAAATRCPANFTLIELLMCVWTVLCLVREHAAAQVLCSTCVR